MGKFIFSIVFAFLFSKLMIILFSEEYSGLRKKIEINYIVTDQKGAIACISENIYLKIQEYSQKNNVAAIKVEIENKNCVILPRGEKLTAYEGICDVYDKNSVKMFKSSKILLQKVFVPCFALEPKKLQTIHESNKKLDDSKNLNEIARNNNPNPEIKASDSKDHNLSNPAAN